MIQPWIVAICLQTGAVKRDELIAAMQPHCSDLDTKLYEDDVTFLELAVDEALAHMFDRGRLRHKSGYSDVWVMSNLTKESTRWWISVAIQLDADLPPHFCSELV